MKILLDECTPRIVKKRLPHLDIHTTQEMGWAGRKNGELLAAAESQFDVFITTDKKLRSQQNLKGHKLAILLLPSNQVPIVEALMQTLEESLQSIQAGDFIALPSPT
jgi:predicted nuclease of predicted toxin-antitoxin system